MTTTVGNGRKYLLIDLTAEKWGVQQIPLTHYRQYPGGEGLGLSLWSYFAGDPASVNPLGGNNPLCIASGALTGTTTSCAEVLSIVSKSPLTGLMSVASAAVPFSSRMKQAGWDAIVLLGGARRPMILHIGATDVNFITSEKLIGLDSFQTLEVLSPNQKESVLLIGPAGEHLVPYASIMSEGLPIGRGGLGAVLGSKRIKAIIVEAEATQIIPTDLAQAEAVEKEFNKRLMKSRYLASMEKAGSLDRITAALEKGFAAVANFSNRTDVRMVHLTLSECVRKFAIENRHCSDCRFDCKKTIHLPNGDSGALVGFEECLALGSNLLNFDMPTITLWYETTLKMGLDPLSTGNVLGWAMEAQQRHIIDWAPMLAFGQCAQVEQVIKQIALHKGIGVQLALGVKELSKRFGGLEFAYHIQGLEMPPYDVRGAWGEALLQGVKDPYPFMFELLLPHIGRLRESAIVEWVYYQEALDALSRTLGLCPHAVVASLFDHGVMSNRIVARMVLTFPSLGKRFVDLSLFAKMYSALTGFEIDVKNLLLLGRKIVHLRHRLDREMKGEMIPVSLPLHFLLEPQSNHTEAVVVPYRAMQLRYRKLASRNSDEPVSLSESL